MGLDRSAESMASDFWAGYLSGALGIIIGNPLDVIKVRLQAGNAAPASASPLNRFEKASSLVRGMYALRSDCCLDLYLLI